MPFRERSSSRPIVSNPARHISFVASEVGSDIELGVLSTGATADRSLDDAHYITVMANVEKPDEWGVYVEVDGQENSGYQMIKRVELNGSALTFTLNEGMGNYPNLQTVTVDLRNIDAAEVEALRASLNQCLAQSNLAVEVIDQ